MNMKSTISSFFIRLSKAAFLYKIPSFFAFLFTTLYLIEISGVYKNNSIEALFLNNLIYASFFGFFITLVAYFCKNKKLFLTISLIAIVVYFYSLPLSDDYSEIIYYSRFFSLILIALFLLISMPFLTIKNSDSLVENRRFLYWILNILEAFMISLFFGVFLYISMFLSITAINFLFGFDFSKFRTMDYLGVLIFGIFSSHYFLYSLEKNPTKTEISLLEFNKVEEFFAKYILSGVITIYTLILFGYIIMILFTQEIPQGVVAWLSIIFAFFVIVSYIFWTPYKNRLKKPLILFALIQLTLLAIALYLRVDQYSWSTNRYMITLAAIWFAGSFLYILISKKYAYKYIFLALVITIFVSQYGYKTNSYYINDLTQLQILKNALSADEKLSDNSDKKILCDISSSLSSLYRHRNMEFINQALPDIYEKYKNTNAEIRKPFLYFATKELGFELHSKYECMHDFKKDKAPRFWISESDNYKIDIHSYSTMYKNRKFEVTHKNNKYISGDFDFTELVENLKTLDEKNSEIANEDMIFIDKNIKIVFYRIDLSRKATSYFHGDMFVKE